MDFLKEILGDELYGQVKAAIDQHNGNEENKDNQIKIGNLGAGEYVSKAKHDSLQSALDGKDAELVKANELIAELKKSTKGNDDLQGKITGYETQVAELQSALDGKDAELVKANELIAELKKSTKGNDDLQGKITGYETQVAELQEELAETKIKAAVKVALLSEKALDVDYLTFKINEKLNEQEKSLELDENGNIKGWDDVISGLKTQFPSQFDSAARKDKGQVIDENKLPASDDNRGLTKEDILKKPYAERMKIYEENPEAYNAAMHD